MVIPITAAATSLRHRRKSVEACIMAIVMVRFVDRVALTITSFDDCFVSRLFR